MSKDFETLEEGTIGNKRYYVARRLEDGWTRCWVGKGRKRRTMKWLKKAKRKSLDGTGPLVRMRAAPKTAYSELVFASEVVPKNSLVAVLDETVRQLAADPEYRRSQEQLLRGFMRLHAPSFNLVPDPNPPEQQ